MRALLDTHVFLWLQTAPERVGEVIDLLADPANEMLVSACSAWEIGVQYALGRLPLPEPPASYVPSRISAVGAVPLAIELLDALGVAELPLHHRDPFDRMLVAQARRHGLVLVTADKMLLEYDVQHLLVP